MANATEDAAAAMGAEPSLEQLGERIGLRVQRPRRWYARVVHRAFRRGLVRWAARRAEVRAEVDELTARGDAMAAIGKACFKSAGAGAAASAIATGGAVLTAETCGWGVLVAAPATAVAIGGEMVLRAKIHVDLACHLAEIYGVPFDPRDEDDLWRLYALVFETDDSRRGRDRGRARLESVARSGAEEVAESLGGRFLQDAVLRDIVPFFGVAISAVGSYLTTRRLGDSMRRFMRYERALRDAVRCASGAVLEHLDLLIEGLWYVFVADGALSPEEAATLAHLLRPLDRDRRQRILARFVDDERGWIRRVGVEVTEHAREPFLHALEVAAALDKLVGPPERRMLRSVAEAFGRAWDPHNVERLVAELQRCGVAAQE